MVEQQKLKDTVAVQRRKTLLIKQANQNQKIQIAYICTNLNISSTKITHNNKISLMFEQKQTHAYKSKCKKKNIKHKQQNEHKYMKQQLKLKQSNTNISN